MAGRPYLGIPREMIPWEPTVDPEKCIGCGECLNNCPNGVFVLNEDEMKAEVNAPGNCVVLCDKCAGFCATDAITFPDKEETKKLVIRLLRELRAQGVTRDAPGADS